MPCPITFLPGLSSELAPRFHVEDRGVTDVIPGEGDCCDPFSLNSTLCKDLRPSTAHYSRTDSLAIWISDSTATITCGLVPTA